MAFHVRDAATDAAVRKLAGLKGMTLTETIRGLWSANMAYSVPFRR
jgi:hypothetical protein